MLYHGLAASRAVAVFAVVGLALGAGGAATEALAQRDETDALGHSDPQGLLEGLGYHDSDFELVMQWTERSRSGEDQLVSGFRLAPRDGVPAFDVYCGVDGSVLGAAELSELGIPPKDWSPRAVWRSAEIQPGFPKQKSSLPPEPSALKYRLPVSELALPGIDLEAVLEEDASGVSVPDKGVARIGVFQDLYQPVEVAGEQCTDGKWSILADGTRIWTLEIRSLGALGQRLHFAELALPEGVEMLMYNADDPSEVYDPFAAAVDFWTPTCFGEGVVVECRVPESSGWEQVRFSIDRTTYNYRSLDQLAKAGACNVDVTCYPAWQTAALGVGGIGSIGSTGTLWCTGSLLVDSEPGTFIPYFLTANHCISTASAAGSMEVYWLYQTSACNGSPPSASQVPRTTGGADYLAGTPVRSPGSDFSLLRLRQNPPAGLTYLGFDTGLVGVGTSVVCIHHPSGDHKRISFASTVNSGRPGSGGEHVQPLARFHEVVWQEGTTESGSSGSPLLLTGTQRIVGQLWGGYAACSEPDEPDYFGRFDVTYPLVESWLGQGGGEGEGEGVAEGEGEGEGEGEPVYNYDVDQSGVIDADDLDLVIQAALALSLRTNTDVDLDGFTDAQDIHLLGTIIVGNR